MKVPRKVMDALWEEMKHDKRRQHAYRDLVEELKHNRKEQLEGVKKDQEGQQDISLEPEERSH